ncbi:MAG: ABC transporter permease [Candidatus Dormibacteria bacterium]
MTTWIKVARFQLFGNVPIRTHGPLYRALPLNLLTLPWGGVLLAFAIVMLLGPGKNDYVGSVVVIFLAIGACGLASVGRSLPFLLALGASRRSYFFGTTLLAGGLSAVYGLVLAALQVLERTTGGWGVGLHFFRVTYFLDGPWYLTWLTSLVVLTLFFAAGMWFRVAYHRWNFPGRWLFSVCQIVVLVIAARVAIQTHSWKGMDHFPFFYFTTISAAELTGVLAAFAALQLAGTYLTMRRVTV